MISSLMSITILVKKPKKDQHCEETSFYSVSNPSEMERKMREPRKIYMNHLLLWIKKLMKFEN